MDHIAAWKEIDSKRQHRIEDDRTERDAAQALQAETIKAFLERNSAENIDTNGYWYDFDYHGMSVHFCDQTGRIVGTIHRPFLSESDKQRYEREEGRNFPARDSFIQEYCYVRFCEYGIISDTLEAVFYLVENAIGKRTVDCGSAN